MEYEGLVGEEFFMFYLHTLFRQGNKNCRLELGPDEFLFKGSSIIKLNIPLE